jgi:hypothetical protein
MPKPVKRIGGAILVGAIIGLTGGLALGALGIGAFTLKSAVVAGALWGGLQGAAMAFAKKPNMNMGPAQARLNLSTDPQAEGKWVFGETPCALDIVHQEQISEDVVAYVVHAASHEIDSFGQFFIEDEEVTFSGINAVGDYAGALQKDNNLGTSTQNALVIPDATQWNAANARGRGIAHFYLRWDFGDDNEKLEAGIPNRLTQVVKGSKVYDPRLDSTRGGSGSHRANDQSTWEWSDNWALIVAHYLLGYRQDGRIVYGVGVNPDDVDWDQCIAMANVCDETVDGKPRYRVGGLFPTNQDHEGIVRQLEASIGGKVAKIGGRYYIWCPHDDLFAINTITDNQVLREAGVNFTPAGPLRDLFNTARGRYIEPDAIYQPVPYPSVFEGTAITEDGRERLMDRDFSIIQDRSIAERVAREMVRRSRFTATWTLAVGPAGLLYQPFSVVNLNIPETDNTDVLARVVDFEFSPEGVVVLTLIEEDASIYDTTLPLGTAFVNTIPDSYDPTKSYDVNNLAATPISVTGSGGTVSDAFQVTWNDPGRFVFDTEVRYRIKGDTDFSYVQATRITSAVIVPVEPNTLYEIEARHISITGVAGPYESIEVTSGNNARSRSVTGSVDYPEGNQWTFDPAQETSSPVGTLDAVFEFRSRDTVIASRTVRATIDPATGNITVDLAHATSDETTVAAASGDGTKAVAVRVTHVESGTRVTAQFTASEVGEAVTGSVTYSQSNAWSWYGADQIINPPGLTTDAVFTFQRKGVEIASRTVRATIDPTDGTITVNTGQATSNESTTPVVTGDGTLGVFVTVEHDDSGVKVVGQFSTVENLVDLTQLELDLDQVEQDLITLNTITLPALQGDLDTLNDTTLPALQNDLSGLQAKFPIQSVDIGDDQITAPKIFAGAVIAGKIAADAIAANEIKADTITGNMIKADTITAFNIDADTITANEIKTGTITSLNIGADQIKAVNIDAGAVTANKIDVANLSAISASTGTLTSNLIRTAATGQRLELTDSGTDATFAIWIGDSTKNDANGVFWVKHTGAAKIDGGTFNIGTRGDSATASNTALAAQGSNTLTVSTGDFTSNGNAINITGAAVYFANSQPSGTCAVNYSAVPAGVNGNLRVQRSTDGGSNWTNVGSLVPFEAPTNTQDFGTSPDPVICYTSASLDKTFTVFDSSPPTGNVRYRIIYDSFASFFTTGQTQTNRLEITALQG